MRTPAKKDPQFAKNSHRPTPYLISCANLRPTHNYIPTKTVVSLRNSCSFCYSKTIRSYEEYSIVVIGLRGLKEKGSLIYRNSNIRAPSAATAPFLRQPHCHPGRSRAVAAWDAPGRGLSVVFKSMLQGTQQLPNTIVPYSFCRFCTMYILEVYLASIIFNGS